MSGCRCRKGESLAIRNRLPIKLDDLELTIKETQFIGEYCTSGVLDPVASLKKARLIPPEMPKAAAHLRSLEIMNRPNIKTAIQRIYASTIAPYQDEIQFRMLKFLQIRAFYQVSDFFNEDGSCKELGEISVENQWAIDGIEEDFKGKDADRRLVRYKLADREEARKQLQNLLKTTSGSTSDRPDAESGTRRDRLAGIFNAVAQASADGAIAGMKAQAESMKKAEKVRKPKAEDAEAELVDILELSDRLRSGE